MEKENSQFLRTELLLGAAAMDKLQNAHVLLAGVGAVGGMAAEVLARTGVGRITVIDFDTVDITNINRQIVALCSTVGMKKIDVMAARIKDINPSCKIAALDLRLTPENIKAVLQEHKPDIVLDAIDDVSAKTNLIAEAARADITCISSMGAAMRTDPARIKTDTIKNSNGCPLARAVRKNLNRMGIDTGKIYCTYSDQPITDSIALARDDSGTKPSYAPMTMAMGLQLAFAAVRNIIV